MANKKRTPQEEEAYWKSLNKALNNLFAPALTKLNKYADKNLKKK